MKSIICKINGEEGVTIPGILLKQLNLSMGDDVEMYTENGLLIIEPARQYEYSLTELLQQCDAQSTALDQDDIAWLNS
ncbi:MAG: AbrB family transcriptional regulator [Idiomarina sp.]|nr:AbrB family transcriptional regulator [Idiomarina sp.]